MTSEMLIIRKNNIIEKQSISILKFHKRKFVHIKYSVILTT